MCSSKGRVASAGSPSRPRERRIHAPTRKSHRAHVISSTAAISSAPPNRAAPRSPQSGPAPAGPAAAAEGGQTNSTPAASSGSSKTTSSSAPVHLVNLWASCRLKGRAR